MSITVLSALLNEMQDCKVLENAKFALKVPKSKNLAKNANKGGRPCIQSKE